MIHSRVSFDTTGGSPMYINDRTTNPLVPQVSPFYYIKLENVDGLYGADIETESHPLPHDIGEAVGEVHRRGKTVTLTGIIWAITTSAAEAGSDYLQSVFADTSPRKLKWTRINDGVGVYLTCYVSGDLSIVQTLADNHGHLKWPWTVSLRAPDPRSRATSGGGVYPSWQA